MKKKLTILVVDDETEILKFFRTHLAACGFGVVTAATGQEALNAYSQHKPELVILDLMLPELDGFEVCRRLREWSSVPIIVVSAKSQDHDKVQALDLGADDYLVKPFSTDELLARIRAVLRRNAPPVQRPIPSPSVYRAGGLQIDFARATVVREGKPVRLTPTEFSLLRELVVNAGRPLTPSTLLRLVWGPEYRSELGYIRVFINRLRTKLEPDPEHPRYIRTGPGIGYRFDPNPESE